MKLDSVHAEVACLQIQWCEFKPPVVYRGKYRQCFSPELHYSQTEGRGDRVARAMKNFRHETKSNFLGGWTDEYRQTHRLLEGDFLALLWLQSGSGGSEQQPVATTEQCVSKAPTSPATEGGFCTAGTHCSGICMGDTLAAFCTNLDS